MYYVAQNICVLYKMSFCMLQDKKKQNAPDILKMKQGHAMMILKL
jgi:hypothetical protein